MAKVYSGRLLAEKLKLPSFIEKHSEEELAQFQADVANSLDAERRVIQYADWLLTAVKIRNDDIHTVGATVPDPHPCSKNVVPILDDPVAMDADYADLANCVQRHVCRPQGYCHNTRGTGCRFGYPKPNEEETKIVFEPIGTTGHQKATIVVKRNDQWLNIHSRTMLHHWRANIDLQLILDPHAAMTYMVKYATKPESSGSSMQSIMKADAVK